MRIRVEVSVPFDASAIFCLIYRRSGHIDHPHAAERFCFLDNCAAFRLAGAFADADGAGVKIQVGSVQGDQLAAPASGKHRHDIEQCEPFLHLFS